MGVINPTAYCCSQKNHIPDINLNLDLTDFRQLDFQNPETYKKLQKFSRQLTAKLQMEPQVSKLIERIVKNKQEHLLIPLLNKQTVRQKMIFLKYINQNNLQIIDSLYHNIIEKSNWNNPENIVPCDFLDIDIMCQEMRKNKFKEGLNAIKNQQVQIFLLAGGSNSRFHSVKFLRQIKPFKKSILEMIFIRLKRIVQLTESQQCPIHVSIMCNLNSYTQIKNYVQRKLYFNFPRSNVQFLFQNCIPVATLDGRVILNSNHQITNYPRGTAEIIHLLNNERVKQRVFNGSIKYLYVCGLQNILQKPCDPLLLGEMISQGVDIATKCVDAIDQNQEFLRYAKINGEVRCVEPEILLQASKKKNDIRLQKSPIALNSVFFKTSYLKKLIQSQKIQHISKEIHSTIRNFTYIDLKRDKLNCDQQCYVFENHLGDLFFNTKNILIMKVKRQQNYSPVITQDKEYSFQMSQNDLKNLYQNKKRDPEAITFIQFSQKQYS